MTLRIENDYKLISGTLSLLVKFSDQQNLETLVLTGIYFYIVYPSVFFCTRFWRGTDTVGYIPFLSVYDGQGRVYSISVNLWWARSGTFPFRQLMMGNVGYTPFPSAYDGQGRVHSLPIRLGMDMVGHTSSSWWQHANKYVLTRFTSSSWWQHANKYVLTRFTSSSWWQHADKYVLTRLASSSWWQHADKRLLARLFSPQQ